MRDGAVDLLHKTEVEENSAPMHQRPPPQVSFFEGPNIKLFYTVQYCINLLYIFCPLQVKYKQCAGVLNECAIIHGPVSVAANNFACELFIFISLTFCLAFNIVNCPFNGELFFI